MLLWCVVLLLFAEGEEVVEEGWEFEVVLDLILLTDFPLEVELVPTFLLIKSWIILVCLSWLYLL
jgi:hypothetical protein